MKKIKPFIDNRWTIGIFSSLIATIIIYTFNEFFELFEWIIVWEALYFFLTYKIPLYLIFLGIIVYFLVKRYRRKKSYKNYKKDTFYGFKWSWEWDLSGDNVEIKYLNIHCPKCDTPLLTDMTEDYSVYCPRCSYRTIEIVPIYVEENIKTLILDNAKRRRFPKKQVV